MLLEIMQVKHATIIQQTTDGHSRPKMRSNKEINHTIYDIMFKNLFYFLIYTHVSSIEKLLRKEAVKFC